MSLNWSLSGLLKLLLIAILIQYVISQNCSVLNCTTCMANTTTNCSACQPGFTAIATTCCTNSSKNCKSCRINPMSCDSCTTNQYALFNNTCSLCSSFIISCSTCTNYTFCLTCVNVYLAVNLTTSTKCQPCSDFMPLCLSCNSQSLCTSCVNTSYAVNITSKRCQNCSQIIRDCTNCLDSYTCILCRVNPNIVLSAGQCKPCINVIPKCLNCTTPNFCTVCSNYYALKNSSGISLCYACSVLMTGCLNCTNSTTCTNCSVGLVVKGGCSMVPGCIVVIQSSSTSICSLCNAPEFQLYPVNGSCVCSVGHLAGKYCTQIIGCTNIVRMASGDQCTACNTALHFYVNNSSCSCQQYFFANASDCQEICGDGKLFVLSCDDGNTIDGDGCSSNCKVERGYHCSSSNNDKSICVYDVRMKMYLDCVNNLGGNKAEIVFSISPSIDNFAKSNLTDLIAFNTSLNFTYVSYKIINLMLYVTIEYEQDIENGQAIAVIGYDQNYFTTTNSIIPFTFIDCNQYQLIYDPNPSEGSEEAVTAAIKAICALAWLAWAVGSFAHKMVGVETLHTIQLIFIMQAFALRYKPVVTYFKQLNSVLNAYQSVFTNKNLIRSNEGYLRLGYSTDLSTNISVITITSLPCLIAFIYLLSRQKIESSKANPSLKQVQIKELKSVKKWVKYQTLLYRYLIFPILMGAFVNCVLSLMIQSNIAIQKQSKLQRLSAFISFFMTFSIFIVFFKQFFSEEDTQSLQSYKKGYTSKYLFTIFLITIIVHLFLSDIVDFLPIYFVAGAEILYSATILLYRPYTQVVHISGIIINQTGILINVAWILSQQYVYLNRQIEEIIAFALIGWIFVILVSSFARAIYQIRMRKTLIQTKQLMKPCKKRFIDIDQQQFVKAITKQNQAHINQYCLNLELLKKRKNSSDTRYSNQPNEKDIQDMNQYIKRRKKIKKDFNYFHRLSELEKQGF